MFDNIAKYLDFVRGLTATVKKVTDALAAKHYGDVLRAGGDFMYSAAPLADGFSAASVFTAATLHAEAVSDVSVAVAHQELTASINALHVEAKKFGMPEILSLISVVKQIFDLVQQLRAK